MKGSLRHLRRLERQYFKACESGDRAKTGRAYARLGHYFPTWKEHHEEDTFCGDFHSHCDGSIGSGSSHTPGD